MNNRIGILQVYAGTEGIEKYVYYLASELRKIVRTLVVVSNGVLSEADREKITKLTAYLYEREDTGYDCGAFKDTMENFVTWDGMEQYEELILVNDSCYGPLYPFEEMFKEMDQNRYDLDFWAVTEQEAYRNNPSSSVNDIPYHIQPYFAVVRNRLLHSEIFRNFWFTLDVPDNYEEAVRNYELKFAAYFHKFGYKGGAYIDNSEFCRTADERMPYVMFNIYKLVSKYKSPLVKRKAFKFSKSTSMMANAGEAARKALEYIRQNTTYDSDMILEDMVHHMELAEIQDILHLNYIISEHSISGGLSKKICMCFWINDMDYAQSNIERIRRLPADITICITSNNEAVIHAFASNDLANITVAESIRNYVDVNRGFDYYFFCIDHLSEFDFAYQSVKQSYMDLILDNMIAGLNYMNKVIKFFEEERLLGVLASPEPHFSNLLLQNRLQKERNSNGIFTVGNTYWVKKEIIETLLDMAVTEFKDDFGGKLLQQVKHMGYYCGTLMSELYASLYISSYNYMLNSYQQYTDQLYINDNMRAFCNKYHKLYIYGAGTYGQYCLNFFRKKNIRFLGFIVTNKNKAYAQDEIPIFEINQISLKEDEGIVIAVSDKHYEDVIEEIEKKNIKNVIRFSN